MTQQFWNNAIESYFWANHGHWTKFTNVIATTSKLKCRSLWFFKLFVFSFRLNFRQLRDGDNRIRLFKQPPALRLVVVAAVVPLRMSMGRTEVQIAPTAERVRQRQLLLAVGHRASRLVRRFLAAFRGAERRCDERRSFCRRLAPTARRSTRMTARGKLTFRTRRSQSKEISSTWKKGYKTKSLGNLIWHNWISGFENTGMSIH